MHGALDQTQQQDLLSDSKLSLPLQRATGVHLGVQRPPEAAWSYESDEGRESDAPRPACLRFAAKLFEQLGSFQRRGAAFDADKKEMSRHLHLLPLLDTLTFGSVWARLYSPSNALGWHRDPYPGRCKRSVSVHATLFQPEYGRSCCPRHCLITILRASFWQVFVAGYASSI